MIQFRIRVYIQNLLVDKDLQYCISKLLMKENITIVTLVVNHFLQQDIWRNTSFSPASSLKKHIHTVHEGHKDYTCESCEKSFTSAQNFKKHIVTIHEGRKDYKCNSCDKAFTCDASLKRHILSVNENKKD